MNTSIIFKTDSYKLGAHFNMYPEGTESVYSYYEARKGSLFPRTTFIGLQYKLKKDFTKPITKEDITEGEELACGHFGNKTSFNSAGWNHILNKYGGYLPLSIKALPEGTSVPIENALFTVENVGGPETAFLTSYVESTLSHLYHPITMATLSQSIYDVTKPFIDKTSDVGGIIDFMLHDFGYRSYTGDDAASIGGLAALIRYKGTDTVVALKCAHDYYGAPYNDIGYSVPACYDEDTEILTNKGFKFLRYLNENDLVAQVDVNKNTSFVKPIKLHKYSVNEELVSFYKKNRIDLLVTKNHRMISSNTNGDIKIKEAEHMVYSQRNFPIVSTYIEDKKITLTALDKLRIAFQADGSYPSHKEDYNGVVNNGYPIRFSFKKIRKKERLEKICIDGGFKFTYSRHKSGYHSFWVICPKVMFKDFNWIDLSKIDLTWGREFLNELKYWDGVFKNERNLIKYSSSDIDCINKVSAITSICGYKSHINKYVDKRPNRKICYSIYIDYKTDKICGTKIKKTYKNYSGFVYCVTVPTGIIIVRRNNIVSICGNSEHSVMSALGRDGEKDILSSLLDKYPTGILSVVADTYDIYNFVTEFVCNVFKDRILARNGVFVVRPDSTTPFHPTKPLITLWIVEELYKKFGGYINNKGYKVINDKVRVLYGDGLNKDAMVEIFAMLERFGYSASNIATFGCGSGIVQKGIDRDVCRFAFKSSAQKRNGKWYDVYKEPLDASKASKRGRFKVVFDEFVGGLKTVAYNDPREDKLVEVFRCGEIKKEYTLKEVRQNAKVL